MLLPHGIFEIPALLIAASYGLWLGVMVFGRRKGDPPIRDLVKYALGRYVKVILPLFVIAAAIETALIVWLS